MTEGVANLVTYVCIPLSAATNGAALWMAEWFKRAFDDDRDALVPPPIGGPEGRRVGLVRACASLGVNLSHAH